MEIRKEKSCDIESISFVTREAFKNIEISQKTEEYIIKALRDSGALAISLVAEMEDKVIGHIAFSPVEISDNSANWYGLGPISVLPEYQQKGIGTKLMNEGLARLKEAGGEGCILVGDPNYYKRFGFENKKQITFEGVPEEVFMCLSFSENYPAGKAKFHEGFLATK